MDNRCSRFIDEYINCINNGIKSKNNTSCMNLLDDYMHCLDKTQYLSSKKNTKMISPEHKNIIINQ